MPPKGKPTGSHASAEAEPKKPNASAEKPACAESAEKAEKQDQK